MLDLNAKRIEAWQSANLPIYEPNLFETVVLPRDGIKGSREPNLFFSTDIDKAVAEADIIFLSVNTPTKIAGQGAGLALDIGYLEAATRTIARCATSDKIIVEKSTVPCRTAESLRDILAANGKPGVRFDVLSNPEFLAEGTTISDLLYPDRILIGSLDDAYGQRAAAALASVYAAWVPRTRIITMNLWSSELSKISANALLAQRISSINALSAVCEAAGANVSEIAYAVGLDKRIGPHMLKASVGFGGSCFKKDVLGLVYLSESLHLPEVAAYWKAVVDINEWQKDRFVRRVISNLYNTLMNKRVAVFGFAYKKNTGDTRESAAITVVNHLVAERARVSVYDPQVKKEQIFSDLHETNPNRFDIDECVSVAETPYEACEGAHAIIILTEWDEFKPAEVPTTPALGPSTAAGTAETRAQDLASTPAVTPMELSAETHISGLHTVASKPNTPRLDWQRIAGQMSKPMFVFDGRNIVDVSALEKLGFRVETIGSSRNFRGAA